RIYGGASEAPSNERDGTDRFHLRNTAPVLDPTHFGFSSVSLRGQRESAVLLFQFGRIIRDYPPSPAGLTSNEISIALSLFRSVSAQPAAPDSLCVGYAPERRYLERRLQEIE